MNEPVDIRRRIRRREPSDQPSRWRARALILALLVVIGTLSWRAMTEPQRVADQARREVHRQICGVVALTYTGARATTAAGRQRQDDSRRFARHIGCIS